MRNSRLMRSGVTSIISRVSFTASSRIGDNNPTGCYLGKAYLNTTEPCRRALLGEKRPRFLVASGDRLSQVVAQGDDAVVGVHVHHVGPVGGTLSLGELHIRNDDHQ